MLKKDARYHYGIKKLIKGRGYDTDCWVLNDKYMPVKYIYRASASFMCEELNKAHSGRLKFYVVRCD